MTPQEAVQQLVKEGVPLEKAQQAVQRAAAGAQQRYQESQPRTNPLENRVVQANPSLAKGTQAVGEAFAERRAGLTPGGLLRNPALPVLGGMAAEMIPGVGPVAGPLAAGSIKAAQSGSLGQGALEGALYGGVGLAGKAIGKGVEVGSRFLGGPTKFAKDLTEKAMEYGRSKVPAWKDMSLVDMVSLKGRKALHDAYDAALGEVTKVGKGKTIQLPEDVARRYGLVKESLPSFAPPPGVTRGGSPLKPMAPPTTNTVAVDAADAAKAITGQWKKDPGSYRTVADALDQAGIGDPAARKAYKVGSGMREYMHATKAMEGEVLHTDRAAAGLIDKRQDILGRRGMEDFGAILRGPGAKPVTSEKFRVHPFGVGKHIEIPRNVPTPPEATAVAGGIPKTLQGLRAGAAMATDQGPDEAGGASQ